MMAKMIKQVRSEPAQLFECLQVRNGTVLESLHARLRKGCDAEIKQLFSLGKIVSQSRLNRSLVITEHLGHKSPDDFPASTRRYGDPGYLLCRLEEP